MEGNVHHTQYPSSAANLTNRGARTAQRRSLIGSSTAASATDSLQNLADSENQPQTREHGSKEARVFRYARLLDPKLRREYLLRRTNGLADPDENVAQNGLKSTEEFGHRTTSSGVGYQTQLPGDGPKPKVPLLHPHHRLHRANGDGEDAAGDWVDSDWARTAKRLEREKHEIQQNDLVSLPTTQKQTDRASYNHNDFDSREHRTQNDSDAHESHPSWAPTPQTRSSKLVDIRNAENQLESATKPSAHGQLNGFSDSSRPAAFKNAKQQSYISFSNGSRQASAEADQLVTHPNARPESRRPYAAPRHSSDGLPALAQLARSSSSRDSEQRFLHRDSYDVNMKRGSEKPEGNGKHSNLSRPSRESPTEDPFPLPEKAATGVSSKSSKANSDSSTTNPPRRRSGLSGTSRLSPSKQNKYISLDLDGMGAKPVPDEELKKEGPSSPSITKNANPIRPSFDSRHDFQRGSQPKTKPELETAPTTKPKTVPNSLYNEDYKPLSATKSSFKSANAADASHPPNKQVSKPHLPTSALDKLMHQMNGDETSSFDTLHKISEKAAAGEDFTSLPPKTARTASTTTTIKEGTQATGSLPTGLKREPSKSTSPSEGSSKRYRSKPSDDVIRSLPKVQLSGDDGGGAEMNIPDDDPDKILVQKSASLLPGSSSKLLSSSRNNVDAAFAALGQRELQVVSATTTPGGSKIWKIFQPRGGTEGGKERQRKDGQSGEDRGTGHGDAGPSIWSRVPDLRSRVSSLRLPSISLPSVPQLSTRHLPALSHIPIRRPSLRAFLAVSTILLLVWYQLESRACVNHCRHLIMLEDGTYGLNPMPLAFPLVLPMLVIHKLGLKWDPNNVHTSAPIVAPEFANDPYLANAYPPRPSEKTLVGHLISPLRDLDRTIFYHFDRIVSKMEPEAERGTTTLTVPKGSVGFFNYGIGALVPRPPKKVWMMNRRKRGRFYYRIESPEESWYRSVAIRKMEGVYDGDGGRHGLLGGGNDRKQRDASRLQPAIESRSQKDQMPAFSSHQQGQHQQHGQRQGGRSESQRRIPYDPYLDPNPDPNSDAYIATFGDPDADLHPPPESDSPDGSASDSTYYGAIGDADADTPLSLEDNDLSASGSGFFGLAKKGWFKSSPSSDTKSPKQGAAPGIQTNRNLRRDQGRERSPAREKSLPSLWKSLFSSSDRKRRAEDSVFGHADEEGGRGVSWRKNQNVRKREWHRRAYDGEDEDGGEDGDGEERYAFRRGESPGRPARRASGLGFNDDDE